MRSFPRTKDLMDELGCAPQEVYMERRQRGVSATEKVPKADRAANATEGTTPRIPCMNEYHQGQ